MIPDRVVWVVPDVPASSGDDGRLSRPRHRRSAMRPPASATPSRRLRPVALLLAAWVAGLMPSVVTAADAPQASAATGATALPGVVMTAEPMLGGSVRPGSWMAVRVHLENDGPAVKGELRVSGVQTGATRYSLPVELATGARQDHVLYAQPTFAGSRLDVDLVADGKQVATSRLRVTLIESGTPTVAVVAEHPERIVGDLRLGAGGQGMQPSVLTVGVADLPERVEAWSAMDQIVWQDTDAARLSAAQVEALWSWLVAGGRLVIVGGSTGLTGLTAFPADLLPYRPTATLDASVADLTALIGTLPGGATPTPVLAGVLDHGIVLGRSGDDVIAARAPVGQGSVALMGIDPATPWLAGTAAAATLWRRFLPVQNGRGAMQLEPNDDSQVAHALNVLPAAELPDLGLLFLLLMLYIALISPVNYLVLRRLDRREWAWLTMPALVAAFTGVAWAVGVGMRGTDVVVSQIGIVQGAAGSDRGVGTYYVGLFSPSRQAYDVRVAGAPLLTDPTYLASQGVRTTPLDVVLGSDALLRGFRVGSNVLRAFRAEEAVRVPRLDAAIAYREGVLSGTLVNRSDRTFSTVALVYGGALQVIHDLAPGATVGVDLPITLPRAGDVKWDRSLADRIVGERDSGFGESPRDIERRAVIDQLTGYSDTLGGPGAPQQGPVVLAWADGPALDIDVGARARSEVDTLLVLPAQVAMSGPTVFPGALMAYELVDTNTNEFWDGGTAFGLGRGTMTVDYHPMGLAGEIRVTGISVALSQDEPVVLKGQGQDLVPLADELQPDQVDPLRDGSPDPRAGAAPQIFDGLPEVQLFDRAAGRWVEFQHLRLWTEGRVPSPERYIDGAGALRVRFVNRTQQGDGGNSFSFSVRVEGDIG